MLYIKLTSGDTLIAVEAYEEPPFVNWQERNKIILLCEERKAQGIVSTDGNAVYQLKDRTELPAESGVEENIIAEIIDEYDYEYYKNQLGETEKTETTEPEITEDTETEPTMNTAQMKAKIIELTDEVNMLTECVLEMSQEVYK